MAFWNTKKPQTPPEPDIRIYEAEPPHYEPVEHPPRFRYAPVSYTHLRAHETD